MKPTIYDIASLAGVSIGTVSRVMNNKDKVHPRTRERILSVANKLNFQPSASARGLALNCTNSLMIIVSDIGNIYFAEMMKFINSCCREKGYKTLLADSDETLTVEAEYLRSALDRSIDGLIIAPLSSTQNAPLYRDLLEHHFPIVMLDTTIDGVETHSVKINNERGAEIAVDYLHRQGHRRIAFVCGDIEFQTNASRFNGYIEAMKQRGLSVEPNMLLLNQSRLEKAGMGGVSPLMDLREPPTAIFTTSDLSAIAVIRSLHELGRRVPEDVAVVGFDDLTLNNYLDIPLTTVRQPKEKIARTAVELLLELIEQQQLQRNQPRSSLEVQHKIIEPEFVVRKSA